MYKLSLLTTTFFVSKAIIDYYYYLTINNFQISLLTKIKQNLITAKIILNLPLKTNKFTIYTQQINPPISLQQSLSVYKVIFCNSIDPITILISVQNYHNIISI